MRVVLLGGAPGVGKTTVARRLLHIAARLAPQDASIETIQLLVDETTWRARFGSGGDRPAIDSFYINRYLGAQSTPADHLIDTTALAPQGVVEALAATLGL